MQRAVQIQQMGVQLSIDSTLLSEQLSRGGAKLNYRGEMFGLLDRLDTLSADQIESEIRSFVSRSRIKGSLADDFVIDALYRLEK